MLTVIPDYRVWCDRCNWNLQTPAENVELHTPFDKLYFKLSQRHSETLLTTMTRTAPNLWRRQFTLSRFATFLLATSVHVLSLALLSAGVWLLALYGHNLFAQFGSLVSFCLAWFARPRLGKLPEGYADPQDFPALYGLAHKVSKALGTTDVSIIEISPDFNASFSQVGLRQKKVLTLGAPLLFLLDGEELVALISHELAHGVNGDPLRGLYVGTALSTLLNWHDVLHPRTLLESFLDIFILPPRLAVYLLAKLCEAAANLLLSLSWRDSQRAEYLADYLAATVSGTEAQLGVLRKLNLSGTFQTTLQQVALEQQRDVGFFETFAANVAKLPERELERLRRLERLPSSRVDTTHPPTVYRLDFQTAHPQQGRVRLSPEDDERLRRELSRAHPKLQKRLVDAFRSNLYY
ncbi:hypothetical protein BH24DEI2_BH24DEI2_00120 [soil metagenome]